MAGHVLLINDKGELLQKVFVEFSYQGTIIETDSHYVMNFWNARFVLRLSKDSLEKLEWLILEQDKILNLYSDGMAVTVGNNLILSYDYHTSHEECPKDEHGFPISEIDRSIVFFNEDFSLKKQLKFGFPCAWDYYPMDEGMHYLNPDSIYYAYTSATAVAIACFSSEGELHFNHKLDVPETVKLVHVCKATSNGGVLVMGNVLPDEYTINGFLLYYHPAKDVNVKEQAAVTDKIRVFPNPTTGQLRITLPDNAVGTRHATSLQIDDIVGRQISVGQSEIVNSPFEGGRGMSEITIDISHLASGLYVLKIIQNNSTSIHKVVINH
jgi:hypothetical protein